MVIFDEAHNLESVASDASSFELTSAQIAGAQEEALRCHNLCTEGGVDEVGRDGMARVLPHNKSAFAVDDRGTGSYVPGTAFSWIVDLPGTFRGLRLCVSFSYSSTSCHIVPHIAPEIILGIARNLALIFV